jgi:hypothetical protein
VLIPTASTLILHFGYAERYASVLRQPRRAAAGIPRNQATGPARVRLLLVHPRTSFAVSDVEVRSSGVRSLVLGHSVLSFFYNTAILGIAIGVISGAAK